MRENEARGEDGGDIQNGTPVARTQKDKIET